MPSPTCAHHPLADAVTTDPRGWWLCADCHAERNPHPSPRIDGTATRTWRNGKATITITLNNGWTGTIGGNRAARAEGVFVHAWQPGANWPAGLPEQHDYGCRASLDNAVSEAEVRRRPRTVRGAWLPAALWVAALPVTDTPR